jgi:hypothetical protein
MIVDDIAKILIAGCLMILPLGLTARFALKPIIDAILRHRESIDRAEVHRVSRNLAQVCEELAETRAEMARLREAQSFHLALGSVTPVTAARPAAE